MKKIQGQRKLYIHSYANLCRGWNGFYNKGYGFNWYSKLSLSSKEVKFKDIVQYHHRQTLNHGKNRIRDATHIRIIAPFINVTIKIPTKEVWIHYSISYPIV